MRRAPLSPNGCQRRPSYSVPSVKPTGANSFAITACLFQPLAKVERTTTRADPGQALRSDARPRPEPARNGKSALDGPDGVQQGRLSLDDMARPLDLGGPTDREYPCRPCGVVFLARAGRGPITGPLRVAAVYRGRAGSGLRRARTGQGGERRHPRGGERPPA